MLSFEAVQCDRCKRVYRKADDVCREITLKYNTMSIGGVSAVTQLWCLDCLEKVGFIDKNETNEISKIKDNLNKILTNISSTQ
jgi:hypothetical protein